MSIWGYIPRYVAESSKDWCLAKTFSIMLIACGIQGESEVRQQFLQSWGRRDKDEGRDGEESAYPGMGSGLRA
jgi:hypothetical protein